MAVRGHVEAAAPGSATGGPAVEAGRIMMGQSRLDAALDLIRGINLMLVLVPLGRWTNADAERLAYAHYVYAATSGDPGTPPPRGYVSSRLVRGAR